MSKKYPESANIHSLEHAVLNGKKVTFFTFINQFGNFNARGYVDGYYKKAWAVARKNRKDFLNGFAYNDIYGMES